MKRFVVGGCAALLLAACSPDPSLYLGGPPGPATRVQLSSGNIALTVGHSATVGAAALDEVGNVTGDVPSFSPCGGPVSATSATPFGLFSAAASLDAAASAVGETCVLVSAGGLTDSIHVAVGPAGLVISGPDTLVSTATGAFTATGYDAAGGAVTGTVSLAWTSGTEALLITEFAAGNVTSVGPPGSVAIRARAPNGVVATRPVTIIPGVFTGTLSAGSGAAGLQVIATRGSGDDEFDANTTATFGGQAAFFEVLSSTSLLVAIPATGATGAQNLDMINLGAAQTAKRVAFTSNSAFDDKYGATTDGVATAPSYTAEKSPGNWVYFTHSGFGTGGASAGIINGGTQQDHYFLITAGASGGTLTEVRLEWTNAGTGADVDLAICRADDTGCTFGFSGNTANEVVTNKALDANTTYYVAASMFTARDNIHNLRLRLTGTGFN